MPTQLRRPLSVVILAAGKGKRMNNPDLPKVLVELDNKPLLVHVLEQTHELHPNKVVIVVGHMKEKVKTHISSLSFDNISFVDQDDQLGTGHAVDQARPELESFEGDTLILLGDVPLLRAQTLKNFISKHVETGSDLSVLSAKTLDPTGYGRICRDADGNFTKITEHKDCSEEELLVDEINSGIFCVNNSKLFNALKSISNNNAQGEYYLTDIVEIIKNDGGKVMAEPAAGFDELQGINSMDDLARAEKYYNEFIKTVK